MDEHYNIWIKWECPFCQDAQDEMKRQRVSYSVYVMDEQLEELEILKEQWNHQTVPLITTFKDDKEVLIGGYDNLKEWFNNDRMSAATN